MLCAFCLLCGCVLEGGKEMSAELADRFYKILLQWVTECKVKVSCETVQKLVTKLIEDAKQNETP